MHRRTRVCVCVDVAYGDASPVLSIHTLLRIYLYTRFTVSIVCDSWPTSTSTKYNNRKYWFAEHTFFVGVQITYSCRIEGQPQIRVLVFHTLQNCTAALCRCSLACRCFVLKFNDTQEREKKTLSAPALQRTSLRGRADVLCSNRQKFWIKKIIQKPTANNKNILSLGSVGVVRDACTIHKRLSISQLRPF